jgi:hypothetical protein
VAYKQDTFSIDRLTVNVGGCTHDERIVFPKYRKNNVMEGRKKAEFENDLRPETHFISSNWKGHKPSKDMKTSKAAKPRLYGYG